MAEPTPPKSPQGDDRLLTHQESVASGSDFPSTPVDQSQVVIVSPQANTPALKCMYQDNCETGSQLRKAISHLFGRNKLCTKAIPSYIWVHYCRKHYQRSRYRSAQAWALVQVTLVVDQINRVQAWSDNNTKANRRGDGFLQYWTLQARKREAKRLQEKAASVSRKRPFAEDDDDDDQDMASRTAIPDWLEDKLDQQFDTGTMLDIIRDIKDRMDRGEIGQIPDIEILPEIFTDGHETRTKTTARRNGTKNSGHRHSKSDIYSGTPAASAYSQRGMPITQDYKRSRTGASPYTVQNLAHRPIPDMHQAYQFQMNNGFTTLSDNQANPSLWSPGSYGSNTVLPAPVPQRNASTPLTPDTNNVQPPYTVQGRPLHARSVSENPMLHGSSFGYRPYTSQPNHGFQQQGMFSNYTMPTSYGIPTTYQGFGTNTNTTTRADSDGSDDHLFGSFASSPSDLTNQRRSHVRLQSTPSLHQTPMQQPTPMASASRPLNALPSVNNMGHNSAPSYFTQQHMGLSSVPREGGFGQYPQQSAHHQHGVQQHGTQQHSPEQHLNLPSVLNVDYAQQSANQQHMRQRSTYEGDNVGYHQQCSRRY